MFLVLMATIQDRTVSYENDVPRPKKRVLRRKNRVTGSENRVTGPENRLLGPGSRVAARASPVWALANRVPELQGGREHVCYMIYDT